ncbi:hypothetical protein SAMN05216371_0015 [Streptomyces sp. TLI_053]|nr:hypothetical protein SAMN05216371_0015 [Streptomyces sp. TLI_053]
MAAASAGRAARQGNFGELGSAERALWGQFDGRGLQVLDGKAVQARAAVQQRAQLVVAAVVEAVVDPQVTGLSQAQRGHRGDAGGRRQPGALQGFLEVVAIEVGGTVEDDLVDAGAQVLAAGSGQLRERVHRLLQRPRVLSGVDPLADLQGVAEKAVAVGVAPLKVDCGAEESVDDHDVAVRQQCGQEVGQARRERVAGPDLRPRRQRGPAQRCVDVDEVGVEHGEDGVQDGRLLPMSLPEVSQPWQQPPRHGAAALARSLVRDRLNQGGAHTGGVHAGNGLDRAEQALPGRTQGNPAGLPLQVVQNGRRGTGSGLESCSGGARGQILVGTYEEQDGAEERRKLVARPLGMQFGEALDQLSSCRAYFVSPIPAGAGQRFGQQGVVDVPAALRLEDRVARGAPPVMGVDQALRLLEDTEEALAVLGSHTVANSLHLVGDVSCVEDEHGRQRLLGGGGGLLVESVRVAHAQAQQQRPHQRRHERRMGLGERRDRARGRAPPTVPCGGIGCRGGGAARREDESGRWDGLGEHALQHFHHPLRRDVRCRAQAARVPRTTGARRGDVILRGLGESDQGLDHRLVQVRCPGRQQEVGQAAAGVRNRGAPQRGHRRV